MAFFADITNILNQSFNEDINKRNNTSISTVEHKKIKALYTKIKGFKSECNICYDEDCMCLQCYQCEFKYCETCLTKVISEFSKCSACQVSLINNYTEIENTNKQLINNLNNNKQKKKTKQYTK